MENYRHIVQYYETDKMGITHHSNYIRWMEEARVDFLKKIGWPFERLEELGIISPVVEANLKYMTSTTFAEEVDIRVKVDEFKGVRLRLSYLMTNRDGKTVCESQSVHCFLNSEGRPVRLSREFPDFYETLMSLIDEA
ncbi:MAG: acyl-CoA thioesterase [Clostridia bacterium]|nr:acyl-CoA thioesterase [Clostridia bacterium]